MSKESIRHEGRGQVAVLATVILVVLALIGWGLWALLGGTSNKPHRPPKITLLTSAPPPPPPPPPKFEKKPDAPTEQKEIKVEQPMPKQDTPQPTPELKMEGPAGNGPSAFASGKITSDDVSKLGSGTGTGGGEKSGMFNPFNNYANLLKGELERYLRRNNDLRQRNYTVEVHIWVTGGGQLKRFTVLGSTGDSNTDDAIKQAMSSLRGFDQPPPANMPQPIRLRIVAAG